MHHVQVWWSSVGAAGGSEAWLTDDERRRLRSLRRPSDQARFLGAHVLARRLVADVTRSDPMEVRVEQRCDRCGGPHGRPWVTVGGVRGPHLSLTHAGSTVAAAVAEVPVGIDLEERDAHRAVDAVALSRDERAELERLAPESRAEGLLRYWVRKEAVLKATGHGLDVEPHLVRVSSPLGAPRLLGWNGPGRRPPVRLADVDLDGRIAAVAARSHRSIQVEVRRAPLSDPGS